MSSTNFEKLAADLGKLVSEKNAAYGDATRIAAKVLRELWPEGVKPEQYELFNYATLVIHKLCRIATKPDAFGEDPVQDIAGYSLLLLGRAREQRPVMVGLSEQVDPPHGFEDTNCAKCGKSVRAALNVPTECYRCYTVRYGKPPSIRDWRKYATAEEIKDVERMLAAGEIKP